MLALIAAPQHSLTPVRVPIWNGTIRAGDDFKIAFTLLDDDAETPVDVTSAYAKLSVYRANDRWRGAYDYGFVWNTDAATTAIASALGVVVPDGRAGRINFAIPSSVTTSFCRGRYRLFIEVDQPDGVFTQIEGVLQVREGSAGTLGNAPRQYMRLGLTPLGQGVIPPRVNGDQPQDAYNFPLNAAPPPLPTLPVIGIAVIGGMVLASSGDPGHSAVVGQAVVGQLVLGT